MPKFSDVLFKLCGFPVEGTMQKASIPVKEALVSFARKIFPKRNMNYPRQRVLDRHTEIMQQKKTLGKGVNTVSTLYSRLMHYKNGGSLKV